MKTMNGTAALAAIPEVGAYSHDRSDHPGATQPGRPRCWQTRPHRQHAYGKLHPDGGLAHWCDGVDEPDDDPTGGR